MTFKTWSLALALASSALLTACGGSSTSTNTNVRLLNATSDCAILTMNSNGTQISTAAQGAVASGYSSLGTSLVTLSFSCTQQNGSTTPYYSVNNFQVSGTAGPYTIVMSGTIQNPQPPSVLNENAAKPASGTFNLRVLDTASSAGNLSVFLVTSTSTGSNSDLAIPVFPYVNSAIPFNSYSNFTTPSTKLYEVVVTGSNKSSVTNDIRMDLPNVPIQDQANLTLILTSPSGNLVNGYLLDQQNSILATTSTTGLARVRVVNGMVVHSNTLTTASSIFTPNPNTTLPKFVNVNNTLLPWTPLTPNLAAIGSYVTVPTDNTDSTSISVTTGSSTLSIPVNMLANGQDYTLLVYGNSSYKLVADNNILPLQPITGNIPSNANVRLYNAVSDSTGSMLVTSINQSNSNIISSDYGNSSASVTLPNPFFRCNATGSSVTLSAMGLGIGNSFTATGLKTFPGYLYSIFVTGNVASPNVQVNTDYQTGICQ